MWTSGKSVRILQQLSQVHIISLSEFWKLDRIPIEQFKLSTASWLKYLSKFLLWSLQRSSKELVNRVVAITADSELRIAVRLCREVLVNTSLMTGFKVLTGVLRVRFKLGFRATRGPSRSQLFHRLNVAWKSLFSHDYQRSSEFQTVFTRFRSFSCGSRKV